MSKPKKSATFEVELFIHKGSYGDKYQVYPCDLSGSSHGSHVLLGKQTVTLNVPDTNEVLAEVEMLEKQAAKVRAEFSQKLQVITDRINSLQALEHKPAGNSHE